MEIHKFVNHRKITRVCTNAGICRRHPVQYMTTYVWLMSTNAIKSRMWDEWLYRRPLNNAICRFMVDRGICTILNVYRMHWIKMQKRMHNWLNNCMTNHNELIDVHVHEMGNDMQNLSFMSITYGFQFLWSVKFITASFLWSIQTCLVNISMYKTIQCFHQSYG